MSTNLSITGPTTELMYEESCLTTPSRCERTCAAFSTTFPTTPTGYRISNPRGTTVSSLGVRQCAPGFSGVANVTCGDSGSFLPPEGCAENICAALSATFPTAPAYQVGNPDATTISSLGPVLCAAGYVGTASLSCQCACGTCTFTAPSGCRPCQPGKFRAARSSVNCTDCVAGKYVDAAGSDSPLDCVACVAGTYLATSGGRSASDCISCGVGKYATNAGNVAASDCIGCDAGTFSETLGSNDCVHCAPGSFTNTLASPGASVCTPCEAGRYSTNSTIACVDCAAGKYVEAVGNDDASDCIECATGTHREASGGSELSDCIACGAGKYTSGAGSSTCIECAAGKYLSIVGCVESDSRAVIASVTFFFATVCLLFAGCGCSHVFGRIVAKWRDGQA